MAVVVPAHVPLLLREDGVRHAAGCPDEDDVADEVQSVTRPIIVTNSGDTDPVGQTVLAREVDPQVERRVAEGVLAGIPHAVPGGASVDDDIRNCC